MADLGSDQRPLRVAIVGGGPSGFYAADALLSAEIKTKVDMFDRLPSPFGLVRYGVAPDHQKIKNVIKVYEKIAAKDGFSFFGNVEVGKDLSVDELKNHYDGVVFTCGAETDKKLGIPGEDLSGSYTATEFVGWYNGHPDYKDRTFDLSGEVAVIIGQGNVAVDVCRILSKTVEELKTTDIAQHALDALAKSNIKEIHMIGRRGPAQAAFTPVEVREFGELADCDPIVDKKDMELSESSQKELEDPAAARKKKNYEILKSYSELPAPAKQKKLHFQFFKSPVELKGGGQIETVVFERNQLTGEPGKQKASGTGEKFEMPCGIFFRSVGYRGVPIEGVPFHEQWGTFINEAGRIQTESGEPVSGLYTAGWIKRGPSGVIGTNKADADETIKNLLEDASKLAPCATPDTAAVEQILQGKNVQFVSFEDWKKIDAAEIANGQKVGKPREKFVTVDAMLAAAK